MRFNVITNLANGVGLERDYILLRGELERLGHQVAGVQFNGAEDASPADVNVFLETVEPRFFAAAGRQWAVPNPEWWFQGWNKFLPAFEHVLAKTHDCERIFAASGKAKYLGWRSRDLLAPEQRRSPDFLHVAGKSQAKNTAPVLAAWGKAAFKARLTVISECYRLPRIAGVRMQRRITDDQLRQAMNLHQFHLLPSAYEGWGHALHEGMGVGAVMITTDAPPMNEFGAAVLVPAAASGRQHAAPMAMVEPDALIAAVEQALRLTPQEIAEHSARARERFLADAAGFTERLERLCA
ncbi:MAG: hypothetical protein M3P27_02955 [Acidobacteriota bacterium]|nr:hypothetical protein [Acidobacteriota bacterium]